MKTGDSDTFWWFGVDWALLHMELFISPWQKKTPWSIWIKAKFTNKEQNGWKQQTFVLQAPKFPRSQFISFEHSLLLSFFLLRLNNQNGQNKNICHARIHQWLIRRNMILGVQDKVMKTTWGGGASWSQPTSTDGNPQREGLRQIHRQGKDGIQASLSCLYQLHGCTTREGFWCNGSIETMG